MTNGAFTQSSRRSRIFRICGIGLVMAAVAYGALSSYFYFSSGRLARRAQADLMQGRAASARKHLDWVLWFHPLNPPANLALGKVELAAGATDKAIGCFRRISPASEVHRLASYQLASSFALDGQLTAAETELKQYMRRYEPTQSVWDLYFRLLYLQTRTRDVIALFEQKLTRSSGSVSDAAFLLKAEFVPQEPRETRGVLEEIRQKHPDDVNVQVALAVALMRDNEEGQAQQLLRSALDHQPDHRRARLVLAQMLADRQQFSMAKKVLWQSGGDPDPAVTDGIAQDDRFWSLSSRLAEQDANQDLALRYIDRALQIRGNDRQYLSQRAQILRQLSRREEATVAAEMSIEAGRVEQDLFLLARQLETRPIRADDCKNLVQLYRRLERPTRVQLWEQMGRQLERSDSDTSVEKRFRLQ